MVYQYIQGQVVIAHVEDTFNIQASEWMARAPKWIQDGINLFDTPSVLTPRTTTKTVKLHSASLPCAIKSLIGITKDGYRLSRNDALNLGDTSYSILDERFPLSQDTYKLNGVGGATFSFREGEITIYWLGLPYSLDSDYDIQFPMIPDNQQVVEALTWYCIWRLILRGHKHHTITLEKAEVMWNYWKREAEISISQLDLDEREELRKILTNFFDTPTSHYDSDYLIDES